MKFPGKYLKVKTFINILKLKCGIGIDNENLKNQKKFFDEFNYLEDNISVIFFFDFRICILFLYLKKFNKFCF